MSGTAAGCRASVRGTYRAGVDSDPHAVYIGHVAARNPRFRNRRMARHERPLSPHLQIYRPQLTSVMSILHRVTGLWLGAGTLLLAWWLIAAAAGPQAFATVQWFMGSWLGYLLLVGWSLAFFYHLCNGIRHLLWDAGWGFDLPTAYRTGWTVAACTLALTAAAWIIGLAIMP